ncbi:unnamed protein product [Arctogadus glacialis]
MEETSLTSQPCIIRGQFRVMEHAQITDLPMGIPTLVQHTLGKHPPHLETLSPICCVPGGAEETAPCSGAPRWDLELSRVLVAF